jgi:hypothetical protein
MGTAEFLHVLPTQRICNQHCLSFPPTEVNRRLYPLQQVHTQAQYPLEMSQLSATSPISNFVRYVDFSILHLQMRILQFFACSNLPLSGQLWM